MGFKENLKNELEYKGMLVKELAFKTGLKRQSLDNYLSTHNTIPNAEVAVKIAQALGTTVEYLITGERKDSEGKIIPTDVTELISCYKSLSQEKQQALLQMAKLLK